MSFRHPVYLGPFKAIFESLQCCCWLVLSLPVGCVVVCCPVDGRLPAPSNRATGRVGRALPSLPVFVLFGFSVCRGRRAGASVNGSKERGESACEDKHEDGCSWYNPVDWRTLVKFDCREWASISFTWSGLVCLFPERRFFSFLVGFLVQVVGSTSDSAWWACVYWGIPSILSFVDLSSRLGRFNAHTHQCSQETTKTALFVLTFLSVNKELL